MLISPFIYPSLRKKCLWYICITFGFDTDKIYNSVKEQFASRKLNLNIININLYISKIFKK